MSILTATAPVTMPSSGVGVEVCGVMIPVEKADFKLHCKKTEMTSTTSYHLGFLWDEFSPGNLGGSLGFESHWRITAVVTPPMLLPGYILPFRAFIRRPGTYGVRDRGVYYAFRAIVEDSSLTLDPRTGVINWKVSTTITGPVASYPTPFAIPV